MSRTLLADLGLVSEPDERLVGGKAAGLVRLRSLGMNVLPAHVVPTVIFEEFVASLGLSSSITAIEECLGSEIPLAELAEVRCAILDTALPEDWTPHFDSWFEVSVPIGGRAIVRSSADVEDNEGHSFAGIFDSVVCDTAEGLEGAVREVWASVFSPRAFSYSGIASLSRLPSMAVILQPFAEADRSGVMFTSFGGPDGKPQILVEHVEGDCQKLVSGEANPERLWIPKVPNPTLLSTLDTGQLDHATAMELAALARELETAVEAPQDVEWLVGDGGLVLLQSRPITAAGMIEEPSSGEDVLLHGVGASPGRGSGGVHLVFNIEDANELTEGEILTTTMTNPDMVVAMQRSAGIVTDVGGMICHAAIVSRELGIPCVVGTGSATNSLQEGDLVTADGSTGEVIRGRFGAKSASDNIPSATWSGIWAAWLLNAPNEAIPHISAAAAIVDIPADVETVVLDPLCDLSLDPAVEVTAPGSLDPHALEALIGSYCDQVEELVSKRHIKQVFIDTRNLDTATREGVERVTIDRAGLVVLGEGDEKGLEILPLAVGALAGSSPLLPPSSEGGGGGLFGMRPHVRRAPMPPKWSRSAMWDLVPALAEVHENELPPDVDDNGWVDVRPEVPITPFLKALVTPGVETIPRAMRLAEYPLHVQFINCCFHFREDRLLDFFPKLMGATWDEAFLTDMLQRCRFSYEQLERRSEALPATEDELLAAGQDGTRRAFLAWWAAFTEFFSLSFFIQAQGDDCIFPGLAGIAEANREALGNRHLPWQLPTAADVSAPVSPVLTAEYMKDLAELGSALAAEGIYDLESAIIAVSSDEDLAILYGRTHERWHWMRERDLYYEPYDSPRQILSKALGVSASDPVDYAMNRESSSLALSVHFDLARESRNSAKLLYAVKYSRALAIDRENHHIVWLRASYRLRRLLSLWERSIRQKAELEDRDIFFMQPWEILDSIEGRGRIPSDLVRKIRNRRVAYEQAVQLKSAPDVQVTPDREVDYY